MISSLLVRAMMRWKAETETTESWVLVEKTISTVAMEMTSFEAGMAVGQAKERFNNAHLFSGPSLPQLNNLLLVVQANFVKQVRTAL